mmetsp:Transcript_24490/g.70313  ORF Transcript_24490/g.70313 Transcript_24490/m.70313 type:complete len:204 (+) Transcript_24490:426-1037(+)
MHVLLHGLGPCLQQKLTQWRCQAWLQWLPRQRPRMPTQLFRQLLLQGSCPRRPCHGIARSDRLPDALDGIGTLTRSLGQRSRQPRNQEPHPKRSPSCPRALHQQECLRWQPADRTDPRSRPARTRQIGRPAQQLLERKQRGRLLDYVLHDCRRSRVADGKGDLADAGHESLTNVYFASARKQLRSHRAKGHLHSNACMHQRVV